MRLLVAHQVSPARTGGMSRLMGCIHDELARSEEGWEVEYFCADRLPAGVGEPWSRVVFPSVVLRHARTAARAGRPFDVVNVHEPHSGMMVLAAQKLRLLGDTRVVVTSHGLEARAWALEREEARLGRRSLGWKSRLARGPTILWPAAVGLRGADHVFCLNEEDRAYLLTRYGRRAEDVTRLFPGAGGAFFAAAGGAGGQPRGDNRSMVPPNGGRLLFAGTWRHNKGTVDLVPAVGAILAARPAARLTVLGAGVPAETVRAAFPPGVRERVDVVTTTTADEGDGETATIFAAHDVFLLPSLFEGTPLTLIEAMAVGLPVVTTATCGMRDVIRDGENGRLIPVRDPAALAAATLGLLNDPAERARLGRTAHAEAAERYTWAKVAEPARAAYRRLLGRE